jgi:glycosyltransferase involved in cell wall biosynthesis
MALAEAWRTVVPEATHTTLVMCGPPDARRSHVFSDVPAVVMPGLLPHGDIARLMRGAAAVVVPSTYEGFGLPALEGLAAGAPVIAANRGALPEVVGADALLVDPTPAGLASGLLEVLSEPSGSRRTAAGRERAREFSWERAATATLAVYEDALA